jgi:hypothetical protein
MNKELLLLIHPLERELIVLVTELYLQQEVLIKMPLTLKTEHVRYLLADVLLYVEITGG